MDVCSKADLVEGSILKGNGVIFLCAGWKFSIERMDKDEIVAIRRSSHVLKMLLGCRMKMRGRQRV